MTQTTDQVLERIHHLQQLTSPTAAEQSELAELESRLNDVYQSILNGNELVTAEELSAEPLNQEYLADILRFAAQDELTSAVLDKLHTEKKADQGHNYPLPTYAWRTRDGQIEQYKLIYRSQARPCMAALRSIVEPEMRPLLAHTRRFVLDLPAGPIDDWQAAEYGLPTNAELVYKAAEMLLERWSGQYASNEKHPAFSMIPSWSPYVGSALTPDTMKKMLDGMQPWECQRAFALLRLELELETHHLTAVDATIFSTTKHAIEKKRPDGTLQKAFVSRVEGMESIVITGVDERLVGRHGLLNDIANLPYIALLFSTAGSDRQTGRADYRATYGVPQTPDEMDMISRILGYGAWKADGLSFAVPKDADHPAWSQEFQMRATRGVSIAKGVVLPVREDYVRRRVARFEQWLKDQYKKARSLDQEAGRYVRTAFEVRHAPSAMLIEGEVDGEPVFVVKTGHDRALQLLATARKLRDESAAISLRAKEWDRKSRPALAELNRMIELSREKDVTTLVRKDQVKVGAEAADFGLWWMSGTYLRGKTFNMRFNSQGIQLLSNAASAKLGQFINRAVREQCYYPLLTPEGIASVVDKSIGYLRQLNETAQNPDETPKDNDLARTLENLDTLRLSLLSSAIRHTTEGKENRIAGLPAEEGQVRIPGTGLHRLLDMIWASLVREVLRSWGITMKGGLLLTCENSVKRWKFLTSTTADNGFAYGDLLTKLCAQRLRYENGRAVEVLDEISMDAYRALTKEEQEQYVVVYGARGRRVPKFFVPKVIVKLINGDCDGDLVPGLACDVILSDGRVVKLVLIMRYPTIDAPVLWALPAGTPTPWDAAFEEVVTLDMTRQALLEKARSLMGRYPQLAQMQLESRREFPKARLVDVINETVNTEYSYYKQFLGVFGARIPEGADLFGDKPVLCESDLFRLRNRGIKSGFDVKKQTGEITERRALDMIYRKAMLRFTGQYTRKHERLGVRLHYAHGKASKEEQNGNTNAAKTWLKEANDIVRRMLKNGDAIEEQVSSHKKVLAEMTVSPSLFRGRHDRVFSNPQQPREAIPIDYHNRIQNLRVILEKFRQFDSEDDESLEAMDPFGPQDERWRFIQGKETTILNRLLETSLSDVVRAMRSLRTDLYSYCADLDRRTADIEITEAIERQRNEAYAHLEMWAERWNDRDGIMARYNEILSEGGTHETEEAVKRANDYRTQAARVMKDALRLYGESISKEALMLAVLDHWSQDGQEYQRFDGSVGVRRVNATPAIALMGDRITDVFPLEHLKVDVELRKGQSVTVFTTREDLRRAGFTRIPGETGEALDCDRIVYSAQDRLFLMQIGNSVIPWHLAERQDVTIDPARAHVRQIIPVTGNRAVVYL